MVMLLKGLRIGSCVMYAVMALVLLTWDKTDKLGARSAFRGGRFHWQKGVFVVTDARTRITYSTDKEEMHDSDTAKRPQ